MCGITGWVDYELDLRLQKETVNQMNQRHVVRGPDAEGVWLDKHVAIAHRRLIVIDPEGGLQPMAKQLGERRYVIAYNGEIYNMQELRLKLLSLGYPLHTRSDTELILTAYMEWRERCPEYLNGIFAFAIWDEAEEKLFLARDRIGVKPLFYFQKGSTFLFGSEIKSLLAHPMVSPILDEEGLAEILVMGPARTPGTGVFRGIKECKPGCWIQFGREGMMTKPYWELRSKDHTDDFQTTAIHVRELFRDAVKRQLVSDVPIGTMLSGGLDSSAISACAAEVFAQEGRGLLPTFSVDYVDNDKYFATNEFQPNSDAPWVQLMAKHIGSRHHTIYLDNQELIDTIIPAMRVRDLPGMADIDASLMLFSREIKKECTVVLSGECADEVFGGYPWFHREEMVNADTFPWARLVSERIPFIHPDLVQRIKPLEYVEARYQEALAEVPRHSDDHAKEARMRELFYLNLTRWMPTLLDRKDRMSMAYGLEVRVPFCDHHLVEYVWNIPWAMKAYQGREKGLLRYALKGILPDQVIERKKSPYPKTHHPDYLQTMQRHMLELTENRHAPLFQLLDRQAVKNFVEQDLSQKHLPWFGQLMNVPALLAFWLQTNRWLEEYQVVVN
ncbi:asparagine synthase (glutamine-hydrolyzing) [Thermoflavimicrobium dichotomicum]|uniref:asparagine synthase (glutamine-hydrolyzing) n=1 Tax=Thermoflavimicrobium dichotomicum TaxID=46223 RepID=A0A1I3KIF2_9BACL|nr:asparagine synthase (glutamine-hydrolyzing) [Thermoflavimicrobium dichotomicum]SFI72130.1 asparagine synthase (glutamine-hydrolysing) [Thermoflavimicrobium dichotomicum]